MKHTTVVEILEYINEHDPKLVQTLMKTDLSTLLALRRVFLNCKYLDHKDQNFSVYLSMYRYAINVNPFARIRKCVFLKYFIRFLSSIGDSNFKWGKLKLLNQKTLHIIFSKLFVDAVDSDKIQKCNGAYSREQNQ
jgi:hypothetical protein